MAIAPMTHSRPLPIFAQSFHLRTSHLPASACSTGIPSPHVLRPHYAVRAAPPPTRLVSLPSSWCNGNKIDGDLHFGGGGCGGGGGSKSSKPGSWDEDDGSGEGFGVLNFIVKLVLRMVQLGAEPLLGRDFFLSTTIHSCVSIGTEEIPCPSSSHSMHEINLMGDQGSHCNGSSSDQLKVTQGNHSDKSCRTTRTEQVVTRTNNTQDHRVDTHSSDDKTSSDENEKMMKGRRSYVLTMATFSQAGALFLVPYSVWCCSNKTLGIPKVWMDVLLIGYLFFLITVCLVTSHSSQIKDGELSDNAGFKLIQILHAVVLLFLLAGFFIPLHVCRGMSNLVVWSSAAGALLMIVISWSIAFHHKTAINCIKSPCQTVIKWTKNMYEKVQPWMPNVSLSECIKDKFKKMPEEKNYPELPMEPV